MDKKEQEWKSTLASVVVPCYNDGVYLTESMDSVFRQTHRSYFASLTLPETEELTKKRRTQQSQTVMYRFTVHY